MDQIVELERVDLAGVVASEAVANVLDQLRQLGFVIGAEASASSAALGLRRAVRAALRQTLQPLALIRWWHGEPETDHLARGRRTE